MVEIIPELRLFYVEILRPQELKQQKFENIRMNWNENNKEMKTLLGWTREICINGRMGDAVMDGFKDGWRE